MSARGKWCAENLRDLQAWRDDGLSISASSNEAGRMFDSGLRQFISWTDCEQFGGIVETFKLMMEAEPDFLMGRVLSLGLDAQATHRSPRLDSKYANELEKLVEDAKKRSAMITERERLHVEALNLFAHGWMEKATIVWEKILTDWPTDLLAMKCAQNAHLFLGNSTGIRDVVARVIKEWTPATIGYGYVHGLYAFGLEECGEYGPASDHARLALEVNPGDAWAAHAQAHCYEMASDFQKGIKFMEQTAADWNPANFVAGHNWWHKALFHIERGQSDDFETALNIFDQITAGKPGVASMLNVADGASLLARLEFEHVCVGKDRWQRLLPTVLTHIDDHLWTFNDAHFSLVLNALKLSRSTETAENQSKDLPFDEKHLNSIRNFCNSISDNGSNGTTSDTVRIMSEVGQHVCEAISLFNLERYEQAFDQLYPIHSQIYRIGGSHAQVDVFTQLLLNIGLHCTDHLRRTQTLEILAEREKLKPNSRVAERIMSKHRECTNSN